jgi:hypothetical protein
MRTISPEQLEKFRQGKLEINEKHRKRKEKAEKRAVWLRNYQRARARALTRLAQQYPDQYKDLLEQERLADESMAKTWLDITGATSISSSLGVLTDRNNDTSRSEQADGDEQNEGNVGGEG